HTYLGPSLSATIHGGGVLTASAYAPTGAVFTAGEPPTGPAPDLYLRWIVSTLPAGASGEISFKTAAAAGGPLLLPTFVTASLYCDPGLMAGAALGYSDTA